MSRARTAGYVGAMSLLGGVLLIAVSWLMNARTMKPVAPAITTARVAALSGAPLGQLAQGVATSIRAAADALDRGDRVTAARALDAALHASEIGAHATADTSAFERAHTMVRDARRVLQNGGALQDARIALRGTTFLVSASTLVHSPSREAIDLARYEGADVLDPTGVRIGEVEGFASGPDGDVARIRLGGWPDLLGLIDLGGRLELVPLDQLAFGPAGPATRTAVARLTP